MISKRSLAGAIVLIAGVAMVAAGAISASSGGDHRAQGANKLVGSWELTVNRGPLLPLVKGLTTYTRGHSVIGTGNLVIRGPAHGTWEHVSGRLYADTHVFFRFDPTGAFLGTQRINENLRLAPDGDSYTAVAISSQFDPNGNLLASGLRATSPRRGSTSTGSRISSRSGAEKARRRAFSPTSRAPSWGAAG